MIAQWIPRALTAHDGAAFARFERSNREAFELFNEPHPPGHYSGEGVLRAFNRRLEQHRLGHQITRVVTAGPDARWLGVGSLTVHRTEPRGSAVLIYQTDARCWRQGVGGALVADLVREAGALGIDHLQAQIACDNLVSLHLLRRAGFRAEGWAQPAGLRRGAVECLLLSRTGGTVFGPLLMGPHVHQTA